MNNKIDRKYMPLIVIGLVIAYLIRFAYNIYLDFASLESAKAATYMLNIIYAILEYGLLYAFIAYIVVSIIFSAGVRRYVRYMSRNDFICHSLIVIGIIQIFLGFLNIFSILVPIIYSVVSLIEPTILVLAFLLYYFLVIVKKYNLNPVEKSNAFRIWFMGLVIIQGIEVVILDAGVIMLVNTNAALLQQYGLNLAISYLDEIFAIISISLYVAFVLAYVIIDFTLKSKAGAYQDPEQRTEYNFNLDQTPSNDDNNDDSHHDDINDIFDI